MTLVEAAAYLQVHKDTLRQLAVTQQLGVKVGRAWRFHEQQLVDYLRGREVEACRSTSSLEVRSGGSVSRTTVPGYVNRLEARIARKRSASTTNAR